MAHGIAPDITAPGVTAGRRGGAWQLTWRFLRHRGRRTQQTRGVVQMADVAAEQAKSSADIKRQLHALAADLRTSVWRRRVCLVLALAVADRLESLASVVGTVDVGFSGHAEGANDQVH
jgi:hypothetical protein